MKISAQRLFRRFGYKFSLLNFRTRFYDGQRSGSDILAQSYFDFSRRKFFGVKADRLIKFSEPYSLEKALRGKLSQCPFAVNA